MMDGIGAIGRVLIPVKIKRAGKVHRPASGKPTGHKRRVLGRAVPVTENAISASGVAIEPIPEYVWHCIYTRAAMMVIPRLAMAPSPEAGTAICSTSPTARLPPAPASVAVVWPVMVIVPNAVVEPPE